MVRAAGSPGPRRASASRPTISPSGCAASSTGAGRSGSTRSPTPTKDIDQVMADAADLVEVEHVLRQILNVKGQ
jgi:hypothetical protein